MHDYHGRVRLGKATLLNILATLDRPTEGAVLLEGKRMTDITESETSAFRRENLGFVFQEFNLLDTLSPKDGILPPLVLNEIGRPGMRKRLERVSVPLEIRSKRPARRSHGRAAGCEIP